MKLLITSNQIIQLSLFNDGIKVIIFCFWFTVQKQPQKVQIAYQEDSDKLPDVKAFNKLAQPRQLQVIQLNPSNAISGTSLEVLLADRAGCLQVRSIKIWYVECPGIQREDVLFTNTHTGDQNIVVTGTCKQLVGISVPHNPATMVCNTNGTWTTFNNTCPCLKGQQRINGFCTGK